MPFRHHAVLRCALFAEYEGLVEILSLSRLTQTGDPSYDVVDCITSVGGLEGARLRWPGVCWCTAEGRRKPVPSLEACAAWSASIHAVAVHPACRLHELHSLAAYQLPNTAYRRAFSLGLTSQCTSLDLVVFKNWDVPLQSTHWEPELGTTIVSSDVECLIQPWASWVCSYQTAQLASARHWFAQAQDESLCL